MRATPSSTVTVVNPLSRTPWALVISYALSFKTESLSWPDGLVSRSFFISVCSISLQLCFCEISSMVLCFYRPIQSLSMNVAGMTGAESEARPGSRKRRTPDFPGRAGWFT